MDRGHAIIAARAPRPPAVVRAVALAAALLAGCALAVVLAQFAWKLVAPAPVYPLPAPPDDPASVIVAGRLFGAPQGGTGEAVPVADALGDIRLLGVIAARDGAGQALFRVPSGPVVAHSGDEVVPGVRLQSVEVDAVTLQDARGRHRLAFPRRSGGTTGSATSPSSPAPATPGAIAAAAPAAMRNVPPPPTSACQPPAGFRGEVLRLNVELVGGLIAQPEVWRAMVEPAGGALVVKETAGFAQMVGLQQGDRIEQANGIALAVPDDVVGAVLRPLAANQSVHLVGRRNGQRREVWVANVNCGR